jgi:molybdenum cofactor cytidylyltransferase
MGKPKQLLPLDGKPVIKLCLECIIASGVADIVVVLGRNGNEVGQAMGNVPAKIAYNTSPESEMAESVRTGLRKTDTSATGVLVCLSDHPLVAPDTVRTLVQEHSKEPGAIIIPLYRGRKGHPTLFPLSLVREVFSGITLRDVIARHAARVIAVDVPDEGVVLDMDTPGDYERIRCRLEQVS